MLKYAKKVAKKEVEWPIALLDLESYRKIYNEQKIINQHLVYYVSSVLKSEFQV